MWIIYAVSASFFAGITAVLAKCGIQKTDSTVATAVRTVVVLLFSWPVSYTHLDVYKRQVRRGVCPWSLRLCLMEEDWF